MCGLKVRFSQSREQRGVFEYALHVEVISSKGIPSKIFVYHQSPAGLDGNAFAEFDHVATPVDMQEMPEDAASSTVPWYRTDKCVVWVRSMSDLKTAKQLFVDGIMALQNSFDILSDGNNFVDQTDVEFSESGVTASPVLQTLKSVLAAAAISIMGMTSAFGYGYSGQAYGDLDLDENPLVVTNVTFDGLVSLADYTLPGEYFPVTYTCGGTNYTVNGNDGLRFDYESPYVSVYNADKSLRIARFSSTSPYPYDSLGDSSVSNLRFNKNGEPSAPIRGSWPVLRNDVAYLGTSGKQTLNGTLTVQNADAEANERLRAGVFGFDDSGAIHVHYGNDEYFIGVRGTDGILALISDIDAAMYAAVRQIAPDWSKPASIGQTGTTYTKDKSLCTYNGVLYQCANGYTTASTNQPPPNDIYDISHPNNHWVVKKVTDLFLPIAGGEMTGDLTVGSGAEAIRLLHNTATVVAEYIQNNYSQHKLTIPYGTENDTLALLSDIAVKSVMLNSTALTPDDNGAVDVQALGNSSNQTLNGTLDITGQSSDGYHGLRIIEGGAFGSRMDAEYGSEGITFYDNGSIVGRYIFPLKTGYLALLPDMYDAVRQIAPDWSKPASGQTGTAYTEGISLCTYNGILYQCVNTYTTGSTSKPPPEDIYDISHHNNHWVAKKVSELFLGNSGDQTLNGDLTANNIEAQRVELYDEAIDAIGLDGNGLRNPTNDNVVISWPALVSSGTLALVSQIYTAVQQIAPNWSKPASIGQTGTTYTKDKSLCTYNGVLYQCANGYTTASTNQPPPEDIYDNSHPNNHWVAKKVSELFLPLTGGNMKGDIFFEYNYGTPTGISFSTGKLMGAPSIKLNTNGINSSVANPNSESNWTKAWADLAILADIYAAVRQIAPAFDATRTEQTKYKQYELVSRDGVVYQCTSISGHYGVWNASNWTAKKVSELFLPKNELNYETDYISSSVAAVGTDSGANSPYLFMKTRGFGMDNGDFIESLTLKTAGQISWPKAYARIWKYSGTAASPCGDFIASSSPVPWSGSGSYVTFEFPSGVEIASSNDYVIIDFATNSAPAVAGHSSFRMSAYNYGRTNEDFYMSGNNRIVPVATIVHHKPIVPKFLKTNQDNVITNGTSYYEGSANINLSSWDQISRKTGTGTESIMDITHPVMISCVPATNMTNTVVLADNTYVYMPQGVGTVFNIYLPGEYSARSTKCVLILSCTSADVEVAVKYSTSPVAVYVSSGNTTSSVLTPQLGINMYTFEEISDNAYFVTRTLLVQ